MNRSAHDLAGGVAGLLSTLIATVQAQRPLDLAELLGCWAGGVLGARLPDTLEPATNPHHRQAAHAVVVTAGAWAILVPKLRDLEGRCRVYAAQMDSVAPLWALGARLLAGILRGLLPGYVSHMALDATTPMGLPLLGV